MEKRETALRTHIVGDIGLEHVGQLVVLCGWVETLRDHGGLVFLHLRDQSGRLQVVADPLRLPLPVWETIQRLRPEFCVRIEGRVLRRPEGAEHTVLDTREIELKPMALDILNESAPLPFHPEQAEQSSDEYRLAYRYLHLRSDPLQAALRLRSRLVHAMRTYLQAEHFLDIETPMLARSTPEGARDFLVPSRRYSGRFFALPQSPQLFKQLLMVGGVDRYFQVARCFRDEDLRANRQPEFTQLDMEMAFVSEEDIFRVVEGLLGHALDELGFSVRTPFARLSYQEAMNRYGSDAPDLRFSLELVELTDVFRNTSFQIFRRVLDSGGVVKAIVVPHRLALSRSDIEAVRAYAHSLKVNEPAWGHIRADRFESTIAKYWSDEEKAGILTVLDGEPDDLVFFMAGRDADETNRTLGALRLFIADRFQLTSPSDPLNFVWITGFPMFEREAGTGRLTAVHHPFTRPQDVSVLSSEEPEDWLALQACSYDLVLNGQEIGGGSLRNYKREWQERLFEIIGMSKEEMVQQFGFFLEALSYGAPPHGGIAFGLDRLTAILAGRSALRDVMAFPKNKSAACPLTGAPADVDIKQLLDVHISISSQKES